MSPEASPPNTNEELVHLIESVRFKSVRLREGYDMGEVDRLLERTVEALRRGQPVRRMIDDARITPVRLREGYDMVAVDEFLDTIAETADPLATAADPAGPSLASVISEERGVFSKIFRRNQ